MNKRETRQCLVCPNTFDVVKSDRKKYCSHKCYSSTIHSGRKHSEETIQKIKNAYENGNLSGLKKGIEFQKQKFPKIEVECLACHKKFLVRKSNIGRKYCSRKCGYKSPEMGGYNPGSVKNYKSGWYVSPIAGKVWLDSSYEFIVAEHLDAQKYKWKKNYQGFPYIDKDGEQRTYIPDFYISDIDLWVESKGYFTENDKCKLRDFVYNIKLIGKDKIYDKSKWGF